MVEITIKLHAVGQFVLSPGWELGVETKLIGKYKRNSLDEADFRNFFWKINKRVFCILFGIFFFFLKTRNYMYVTNGDGYKYIEWLIFLIYLQEFYFAFSRNSSRFFFYDLLAPILHIFDDVLQRSDHKEWEMTVGLAPFCNCSKCSKPFTPLASFVSQISSMSSAVTLPDMHEHIPEFFWNRNPSG